MVLYVKNMKKQGDTIIVNARHVSCDGGGGELGHPKVYLEIKEGTDEILCPYCSRHFVFETPEDE